MTQAYTGGCQCGRVRYRITLDAPEAYLCHCRMCQRATGGFAAAFVQVANERIEWLSSPDLYQSSPIAERPFCKECGTPLGFRFKNGKGSDVTLGSLDQPGAFHPTAHFGVEALHEAWLDTAALPRHASADTPSVAAQWRAAGLEVPE
ncbi:MAG: GFA family protein [Novosphingobium sp.]